MVKFNLNDYVYISITPEGWQHLYTNCEAAYVEHCILPNSFSINGIDYFKLQMHVVMDLFPVRHGRRSLIGTNILLDENTIKPYD
jgi:hypothetical protein